MTVVKEVAAKVVAMVVKKVVMVEVMAAMIHQRQHPSHQKKRYHWNLTLTTTSSQSKSRRRSFNTSKATERTREFLRTLLMRRCGGDSIAMTARIEATFSTATQRTSGRHMQSSSTRHLLLKKS